MYLVKPSESDLEYRDLVRRHYRVPSYIPVEQIFKYLEKKGIINKNLRVKHENKYQRR